MNVLVLNWAIHKDVGWHWSLFEQMHRDYGMTFTIISGRKMWEPRGGFIADEHEYGEGVECHRLFQDIASFKKNLIKIAPNIDAVRELMGQQLDLILCFHQANYLAAKVIKNKLNVPLVLICEQAFRTSGARAGELTPRWMDIQKTCAKILTWSSVDKGYEEITGAQYIPFGGCIEDIDYLRKGYNERIEKGICIYQGSLTGLWKNSDALAEGAAAILSNTPIQKFIINGYILDDKYRVMVERMQERLGNSFEYRYIPERSNALESLSEAFVAYCPMRYGILANFPIECFGLGVPIVMPFIIQTDEFDYLSEINQISGLFADPDHYAEMVLGNYEYYEKNNSAEGLARHYYDALKGLVS